MGYGRQLVEEAERQAAREGCQWVFTETYSWQALPFYRKLGYEVFATLDDCPAGHKRYYVKKAVKVAEQSDAGDG